MCLIINVYSDNQQSILKYLKDIEMNLNNILIMIVNFNIRDNNWNPLYLYYFIYINILRKIANSLNLEILLSVD